MKIDPGNVAFPDRVMAEIMRRKPGAERLKIANGMAKFAQSVFRSIVRSAHPDWDDKQVDREAGRRISGGAY